MIETERSLSAFTFSVKVSVHYVLFCIEQLIRLLSRRIFNKRKYRTNERLSTSSFSLSVRACALATLCASGARAT